MKIILNPNGNCDEKQGHFQIETERFVIPCWSDLSHAPTRRCLRHIGLHARRPVTCVPLTKTHCRMQLTWSSGHSLWTPQQWSCMMFSDESRFSLQSDSRRILKWRTPGTRYDQENTIE
ncbi:transposable element Tcb1 transposase [Trichonephila clavipes]|nr:transposable element Tcb1 transposase [Trichonephila clavipes]